MSGRCPSTGASVVLRCIVCISALSPFCRHSWVSSYKYPKLTNLASPRGGQSPLGLAVVWLLGSGFVARPLKGAGKESPSPPPPLLPQYPAPSILRPLRLRRSHAGLVRSCFSTPAALHSGPFFPAHSVPMSGGLWRVGWEQGRSRRPPLFSLPSQLAVCQCLVVCGVYVESGLGTGEEPPAPSLFPTV